MKFFEKIIAEEDKALQSKVLQLRSLIAYSCPQISRKVVINTRRFAVVEPRGFDTGELQIIFHEWY